MKNIAIIPARAGSKRLPHKNTLPFMGKPMLIWTCEAARVSGIFDTILVSTEDPVTADIVRHHGFDAVQRSAALATDEATCAQVCLDVLAQLAQQNSTFDALCCLYATAPLRHADDIRGTMALLEDENTHFAFAVCQYSHSPYQALIPDAQGWLMPAYPLLVGMKSQQMPTPVIGNGSTYAVKIPAFMQYNDFYGPSLRGYYMPPMRSVDIDTQEDLDIALCFAEYLKKHGEIA